MEIKDYNAIEATGTQQYLFGVHPVIEAVTAGSVQIEKVLIRDRHEGPQFREILALLGEKKIPYSYVPQEKLDSISKGIRHQGVAALVSRISYMPIDQMIDSAFKETDAPIFVLLDGVSDVRNLGAISRSAECAGANGIIVPAKGGAAITSEGIKSSAGALLRVPVAKVQNLSLAVLMLKAAGVKVVSASEKTSNFLYDVDFQGPVAIIMGAEGKGIHPSLLAISDDIAAIPMAGEISSLNVSSAAAVVLYEAVRQRIAAAQA